MYEIVDERKDDGADCSDALESLGDAKDALARCSRGTALPARIA